MPRAIRYTLLAAWVLSIGPGVRSAVAQSPAALHGLHVKYVRDSEEYATLTRMIYRTALSALQTAREQSGDTTSWVVSVDVDETGLDNSAYELERETYWVPFASENWNSFVARRESGAVPGAVEFVQAIRAAGGRVAWITNRDEVTREDTRENLRRVGLWQDTDRLCLRTDSEYTKAVRRREVLTGEGRCSWDGRPVRILAFIGDALGDFPADGEDIPDAGDDAAFGTRFFMIPNPMYGQWTRRVTRRWPWQ
jgi:5'-nucleotidase (lipoprotein e(P4) family)